MANAVPFAPPARPVWPAVRNGLRHRCPACGRGPLFSSYLKTVPRCADCGEDLSHQRADDGPAYLTVLIVCHVVGVALHLLVQHTDLGPGMIAGLLSGLAIPLSLALLPSMKGLMIGVQWAKRMHGFGG
jgi:uncharacterized protein (DUF983 family)